MTLFWMLVGTAVIVWWVHILKQLVLQRMGPVPEAQAVKKKVLIVDDDEDFAHSVEMMLSDKYDAVTAHNRRQALEIVEEGDVGLALVDLRLGQSSGLNLLKEIMRRRPETLCVIITGYGNDRTEAESIESGAWNYLVKPVDPAKLFDVIRSGFDWMQMGKNGKTA